MKKKVFIASCIVMVVLILGILLVLILNKKDEADKVKDYSNINVEEIKVKEYKLLEDSIVNVKDVRINDGYLEGTISFNSDKSLDKIKVIVSLYDKDVNLLDEISFEFENVSPYEERDLFYAIQKDLSKAYYVDVKEG